ncbi:hypothetical protein ACGFOU_27830 [Streptomyces sp. NPDC048595]|uniref:hypothetical protein n=1 Tax=Streptomyces sp. NPDC048595 TaxID=3365576 RepID=UPI00371DBAB4
MARRGSAARGPGGRLTTRESAARRPRAVPGRWISAALVGGLWWWAVVRLAVWPQSAGAVEGAVALGGWGLSLLPVHCVPWTGRSEGICRSALARRARGVRAAFTRASRRRRSGGGSGRS